MILRARSVMPSSHELYENAGIRIHESQIVEVGDFDAIRRGNSDRVVDLGDVAVLPGFINAHAHLELGELHGKLPRPDAFVDWLRDVRDLRQEANDADLEAAAGAGVRAALESGTTTLVDVTLTGASVEPLRASPIRKLVHFETLGFDSERSEPALETLKDRIARTPNDPLLTVGISPHAPYSTSEQLYSTSVDLARQKGLPICSHVAETVEEEQFVRDGTGPFRDFLGSLGISVDEWKPRRKTPVQYLAELGFFDVSPLLIHGNYIRAEDVPILRDLSVTVVYCPRSHDYFGHGTHPFERLFALGINVALGTDSLASTPSLSVLDEMKFMAGRYPHMSPERILTLGMLNGAKTVRTRSKIGGLRAGWKADVVGIVVPSGSDRISARILSDESEPVFTMVDGRVCYDKLGMCD